MAGEKEQVLAYLESMQTSLVEAKKDSDKLKAIRKIISLIVVAMDKSAQKSVGKEFQNAIKSIKKLLQQEKKPDVEEIRMVALDIVFRLIQYMRNEKNQDTKTYNIVASEIMLRLSMARIQEDSKKVLELAERIMINYKPEQESWLSRKSASIFVANIKDRYSYYKRCISDPILQEQSTTTLKAIMEDIADYMHSHRKGYLFKFLANKIIEVSIDERKEVQQAPKQEKQGKRVEQDEQILPRFRQQ